jgi:hypothetical protein
MSWRLNKWLSLLPLVILALPVQAEEAAPQAASKASASDPTPHHSRLEDPWTITLGGFYATVNTLAALGDSSGGVGAVVDFENALGLTTYNPVLEASVHWRFAERWRLDLDYFGINRSSSATLLNDITWGGVQLPTGTSVNSNAKFSDLRAAVGYSFFKRADKEIGIGLGLHVTQSNTTITATSGSSAGSTSSSNITAPLPVVVLYSNFALTDTWALGLRLDWLSLSYDKYSGEVRSTALDFYYQPYEHVGFGFGWHSLALDLSVADPNARATAKTSYSGPAAFVSVSF